MRTGVPPASAMTSGTAFEQIRLWSTVSPGCFAQHHVGDDRRGERAGDELALVVDEEHPVGVAVEGEADVGAGLEHPGLEVDQVLGLDGVGRVVREGAVELAVEDVELERAGRRRPPGP